MSEFDAIRNAFANIPRAVEQAADKGLSEAAMLVVNSAKSKLGTYQPSVGPYPAWAKLKPATVRRKYMSKTRTFRLTNAGRRYLQKHGTWGAGGNDDAPLVDTGHLRQAISSDLSKINEGVAYVGVLSGSGNSNGSSPGKYAAAHEFGSAAKNIPPRPFLRPAVYENQEAIKEKIAEAIRDEVSRAWR